MSYWKEVAQRARRDAAKAAKIETTEAIVLLVIGQTIVGAVLWFALGQSGLKSNLWARAATFAAPFMIFPLIFAWKFIGTPSLLAREQRDQQQKLEDRSKDLSEQLRQLNERKATLGGRIEGIGWGGIVSGMPNSKGYVVFLRILNTGSLPSVAIDYGLKIVAGEIQVPLPIHHMEKVTLGLIDGPRAILGNDAIYKVTEQPVQAGGMASGHIIFVISEEDERLITTGARFVVSFSDIQGHRTELDWVFRQEKERTRYFPSLKPMKPEH
jgi:hypothetical protein